MLDYVDCNIQDYILYMINIDYTILFYMLYMIILVCAALHKAFVFYEALYHKSFSQFCGSSYTFLFDDGILLVYLYYIVKYIVCNYLTSGYLDRIRH